MNNSPPPSPPLWKCTASEAGPHLMVCKVRFDTLTNPRTDASMRRTVLESPDWVNVVALTPEERIVVVRQFRFGTSTLTTEIPGGVVDPGEEHGAAAQRELEEETGFRSDNWSYLGSVEPNPAFLNNLCHHWLARDARLVSEQNQDPGEDIRVGSLSLPELQAAVEAGELRHALALTALAKVFDLR